MSPEAAILAGHRATSRKRLAVCARPGDRWHNRLYFGDNLPVLRRLLDDPLVRGKVTLVYIDPPFATGSVFASRDGRRAYNDLALGSHYLEFIRQRLVVLRELLHPRGSIYVHLDDKMAFPVKILMDEIFGPKNFRNWITRRKSGRKNVTRRQYGNCSDYLLFYSQTGDPVWNRPYESTTGASPLATTTTSRRRRTADTRRCPSTPPA
jgi:adenine-specific DNA-methyltransferase